MTFRLALIRDSIWLRRERPMANAGNRMKRIFSVFDWRDPLPALGAYFGQLSELASAALSRIRARFG